MRLVSLQVKNFRVFKELSLVFPDNVIGIIGPNGAGKSSIVEAISWALYGTQVARSGKDEIKSVFAGRFEPCEVNLEFAVNGEIYRVFRRLAGRFERPEVELFRGQASESVGVNETRQYVGELLGLDWRGFLTSFLARQQELNALSDLQPSKRRDQLAGMLGIEKLDKAIQKVKEDSRSNERQAGFLERQLVESSGIELRIKELTERMAQLSQQVSRLKEKHRGAETDFERASDYSLKVQQAKSAWLQLQAKCEAEEKTTAHLCEQLHALKEEASKLALYRQELVELDKKLADLPVLREQLETMKLAKSRLEMCLTLTKQETDLTLEKSQIEARMAANDKILADYEGQLSAIPDNVNDLLREHQQRLEQARNEFAHLRERKVSLEGEIGKLKQQMASIAQFGPESVCDRCLRPLGDDLPEIKAHLNKELSGLQTAAGKLGRQLQSKGNEGKKLKESCHRLEVGANAHYELMVKKEASLNEQKSLSQRKEELQSTLVQVSSQLEQLRQVPFDEQQFLSLAQTVEQLDQAQSRYNRLRGELSRSPAVDKAIRDHTQKLAAASDTVASLRAELEKLAFSEKDFEKAQQSFQAAQERLEKAKSEYLAASKEQEVNQKELEGKLEQKKRFEQAATELETCRTNQYYGEKLAGLFSEFRSHLIAQIRPTLAEFSSRLISEMTNGKYSLVELDEKYNLRVMDYGQYYAVDRFSGGEKDLANLCLRLAISLALTESAGLSRSFIILDEVFGSQDSERKELIVKALANLKNRFPQIFLITHVEDIKDQVEELIEVFPTGAGWSEVRINGNPA
jgi:exonuclease SbcC